MEVLNAPSRTPLSTLSAICPSQCPWGRTETRYCAVREGGRPEATGNAWGRSTQKDAAGPPAPGSGCGAGGQTGCEQRLVRGVGVCHLELPNHHLEFLLGQDPRAAVVLLQPLDVVSLEVVVHKAGPVVALSSCRGRR